MKKFLTAFLTAWIILIGCAGLSAAAENRLALSDISVVLADDGSAEVTQIISGNFDEKTENMLVFNNLGGAVISDFRVSDAGGAYETVTDWYADASFDEKAKKCGVLEQNGEYLLCWGISSYGQNSYTVCYRISPLARGYSDCDGFSFAFANVEGLPNPDQIGVRISLKNKTPLGADNTSVSCSAAGTVVEFDGGAAVIRCSGSDSGNRAAVALSLEKGVLSPTKSVNKPFSSAAGSPLGYAETRIDDTWLVIIAVLSVMLLLCLCLALIIAVRRRRFARFYHSVLPYAGLPENDRLSEAYCLARGFGVSKSSGALTAAAILLMADAGEISLENGEITFTAAPQGSNVFGEFGKTVADMLVRAADGGGLTAEQLEAATAENRTALARAGAAVISAGQRKAQASACYKGRPSTALENLTDVGKSELSVVIGLKKYLSDIPEKDGSAILEGAYKRYAALAVLLDCEPRLPLADASENSALAAQFFDDARQIACACAAGFGGK